MDYAQAKRRDDCPWCGGDIDALGLGAAMIWAMLGAISAAHHGWANFPANGASREVYVQYVDLYVGLVQYRRKTYLQRTNGVKLVRGEGRAKHALQSEPLGESH